ncbi:integrin alpha-PS2 isoform X2 [Bradysia coprophila]|uniref:integrin alpha-PS2 isoform X2 n=1 Tax=Bradysia coprophila TaxID=38358 RepID=UPI00187D7037|nr:integrin alpha-PS2 isoform X2 [Bradysia coprophila]
MIQSVNLWYAVSLLLLVQFSTKCSAFNVDTVNYIRHEGQPNSMFGFSVALHREHQRSWVIVGAPQADNSVFQPNVIRGGAVYRCDIADDNRCSIIPFDQNSNQYNDKGEQIDTKSGQWFGATVSSAGIGGPIVACAPRYVFHTMNPRKVERVEPVGTCFLVKNNFQDVTQYSPCRTSFWGYHRQGSCQAGMSAALTKNGDRLFVGAPGSWYWQGQAYSRSLNSSYSKVWSTGESTATEDDSYLGYSAATGDFNGDGTEGVAIGMPRGGELLGKVLLYSWNMTNQQNITGEQIGAYFGYSICVVDVDGDNYEDLIVGAPMYTEPNNEGKYEMGRVYIIFQNKYNKFQEVVTRDGVNSRARFGLALTSLNDINQDGYGDFAVGAPYDGPNGRGAVYIYHGSASGPLAKYSQVIFAEDVSDTYLTTFGFSVSGGIDLDGNRYPDMVVGAYDSNKVVIFKSRPVAVMEATTAFETETKLISLDDKGCRIRSGSNVTCTGINSCLKYSGVNLPQFIDIDVSWVLDSKVNRNPRMYFLDIENKNIRNTSMRLHFGKAECIKYRAYIVDNIRDKLTPLEVEMNYSLRNTRANLPSLTRKPRSILEPVIDQNKGTVQKDSINIQKNCGPDNICIPDLRLNVKTVDKFLLGSKELLTFDIIIPNYGEDAFEAGFFMVFPKGLNFRKVDYPRDSPISCTAPTPATNMTLKCDLGNPLSAGKSAKFKVLTIPSQKHGMAPSYDFYMEVNSTNPEVGSSFDNIMRKSVTIDVETNLTISGKAVDAEIYYNISEFRNITNATKEAEIGPHLRNIYEISNGGPSTVDQAEIFILIPHLTITGDHLMYILEKPETVGNVQCDPTNYVNVLGLKLDEVLSKKSFLQSMQGISGSRTISGTGLSIEKGSASGSSSSSDGRSHTNTVLTEEQRRKFDAEEELESTGDASNVHRSRAKEAAHSSAYASQIGSRQGNGPTVTYTASRNRSGVQGEDGKMVYTESSTEYYGAGDTRSQSYFQQQNQRANANSEASGKYQSSQAGYTAQANRGGYANQQSQSNQAYRGRTGAGLRKIDDIPTEENVNQDISGLQSRTQTEGAVSTTGRRRMNSKQDGEPPRTDFISGMDKVAQGGHGFRAGTLDLGTLGRDNVDDELRHRGSASHVATDGSYQSSRGGYQSGGSSSGHQGTGTGHYSSSNSYSTQGGRAGEHHYRQHSISSGASHGGNTAGSHGYTQSAYGHDGGANTQQEYEEEYTDDAGDDYYENTDDVDPTQRTTQSHDSRFKLYDRMKRQSVDFNDLALEEALHCNSTQCVIIRCVAGPLEKDSSAWISIRTRLVAATLNKITTTAPMNLSTMVVARVSQLPYIGEPQEKPIKRHEVVLTATPIAEPKPDVVPLWVWVLSACIGVLILLLLIYLLYKCGFFKRNRPTDSQERQPLNRNGAYHGDEHL